MEFIGLADIHGHVEKLDRMSEELKRADVVFLVGDITDFGRTEAIRRVMNAVQRHSKLVRAVSGNCDYGEVDMYLENEGISLHGRGENIAGIGCMGLGGSLITPFLTPNEYRDDQLEYFLESGLPDLPDDIPMILVSHTPPLDTDCDLISSGSHVGSRSVRRFIEDHQPMVCFTGHIHEAVAIDRIGGTQVVNPGRLSENRYAWAEIRGGDVRVEIREF